MSKDTDVGNVMTEQEIESIMDRAPYHVIRWVYIHSDTLCYRGYRIRSARLLNDTLPSVRFLNNNGLINMTESDCGPYDMIVNPTHTFKRYIAENSHNIEERYHLMKMMRDL